MVFDRYGISLRRLRLEDLGQVLEWRNSEEVRPFMDYQEIIPFEQHLKWFYTVDNDKNYYFIAWRQDKPFGVYHIKDIDWQEGVGEGGVYLISSAFWGSDLAVRGSLVLTDFAFEALKLNRLVIKVLKENTRALRYNIQLGYIPEAVQPREDVVLLFITPARFRERNLKLITFLNKIQP